VIRSTAAVILDEATYQN